MKWNPVERTGNARRREDGPSKRGSWVALLTVLLVFLSAPSLRATDTVPFKTGEKLEYVIKWGVLPVGEATLQVMAEEGDDGIPSRLFDVSVRSYPVVDLFYPVRDHVTSRTDLEVNRSLLYRKKQREGSHRRDVEVRFDWDDLTAHHFNREEYEGSVAIVPGSLDPLSIFYAFRRHALRDGLTVEIPVTDGKRCVTGKARVIGRETVRVRAGRFDTFLIEPDLKEIGGIFKKSKDAKLLLWVTADERRILVKAKSAVVVGQFTAELVNAQMGETEPSTPPTCGGNRQCGYPQNPSAGPTRPMETET